MTFKLIVASLVAAIIGGLVGFELASRVFFPRLARGALQAVQRIDSEQRYATVVSLAALHKLEAGDTDGAKSFLAHEIISYSKAMFDDSLPENQKLKTLIRDAVSKSPTLQQEAAKDRK
jgi:hypothetical protein